MCMQLRATFWNYRSMYAVFSLLAIMIVVMTGIIPHTVPLHWRINDVIFISHQCIDDAINIVLISFLAGTNLLTSQVSGQEDVSHTLQI